MTSGDRTKTVNIFDNVVAYVAGLAEIASVFLAPWIASFFGVGKMAALGVIVVIAVVTFAILKRMNTDVSSYITLAGLSAMAILMFFFISDQQAAFGADRENKVEYDYIVGEVFLDRNRNGEKDGSDEGILGINLTLRNFYGAIQNRVSDERGLVKFKINKAHKKVQIVVCGIAQSHTLSDNEKITSRGSIDDLDDIEIYKVDIGIELSDLKNCK